MRFLSSFKRRLDATELLTLVRNLAVTLRAGVPVTRALSLFEQEVSTSRRPLLAHLRRSMERGIPLAAAMQNAPYAFPPLVINLVKTGELGGTLRQSLEEIVRHLKESQDLKRKIRSAMLYPTFVLVAVIGLGLSIGTLVLPELIPLFESLDVQLPWTTRLLLTVAAFFDAYGTAVTVLIVVLSVALFAFGHLTMAKAPLHRFLLVMPYIRTILRNAAIAQIAGTLGTLLRSGIAIQEAVEATAEATNNRVYRAALRRSIPAIRTGHTFARALGASGRLFPEMTITLIDIGEETGTLAETLAYLKEYYEGEVEYAVKNLTVALEPILLIGIGLLVGGTVLSIITPLYDVTGSIQ